MPKLKQLDNDDIADLLEMTTEQDFLFVEYVMAGQSQGRAYKAAYGTNALDTTCRVMGARKWHKPEIQALRKSIADKYTEQAARKLEERIGRMERLSMMSEANGNFGAAVSAEQLAGKLEGHYIDKHETTYKRDTGDIERTLRDIANKYGNETMRQIAASDGYSDIADKIVSESVH